MARNGKWPARIALAVSAAMIATLFTVINASGQSSTEALLTVGKDVASGTVTQATYSIVVRNQGNGTSTNVRVRDAVPANTTFESSNPAPVTTSSSPGAPSCDNAGTREDPGTTCEWNVGNLAPGESRQILATYNLNQSDVASYTVTNDVTAVDNEGHETTDQDASLRRDRIAITDDTWVADNEPANTNHGACTHLRVQQGNTTTSFIDSDSLPAANTIDRLFGAQLRLQVDQTSYTQAAPGVIGAHRITQQADWTQGSGTCQGGQGSGTDARTGAEPPAAGTPTGTAQVSAFPQIVNFDLSADLDSADERGTFQGWELRDQATSGTDNFTRFHSLEGSEAAQDPKLFLVYAAPEAPTCIDADPENDVNPFGTEHVMTAFVTDGAKITSSSTGEDACTGGPSATEVEWEVEDEANSDIYFSSQEGVPTSKTIDNGDAKPDSVTTTSDEGGLTNAGIRQDEPAAGSNRIEVRIASATDDPDPPATTPPTPPRCNGPTPIIPMSDCDGENATHDDVRKSWNASGSSGTGTGTGGTTSSTTTSSPSNTASTSPSGSASSPSGSASASSPTGSSPSQTTSTTATTSTTSSSPTQSSRTISLFASSNEVVYPAEVTLSGGITSADNDCDDANEFVRIERRILGQSEYALFEQGSTDADGRFEFSFPSSQSAEYVASAPRHDQCADASSSPQTVTVKVKITARSNRRSVERGNSVRITGRVQPDHDGTDVLLQRRKGSRWVTISRDELDARSRFGFKVKANWRGRRVFRAVWRAQDDEHETNNSRRVVVRTTRP